jgi:hypothetical protein
VVPRCRRCATHPERWLARRTQRAESQAQSRIVTVAEIQTAARISPWLARETAVLVSVILEAF